MWSDVPCRVWTGNQTPLGYGYCQFEGAQWRTHVLAWVQAHGEIPLGPNGKRLEVCHHCDNPACYELEHLWLGTHAENMADMKAKGRAGRNGNHLLTHCKRGHEFTPENTRIVGKNSRQCVTCYRELDREGKKRRRRQRAAA